MNRQRGVIAVLYLWIAGGIAATIIGLGVAVKVQSSHLESCKTASEAFKAKVTAQGELAAKQAKLTDLANQKAKEQADAKTKQLLADNATLVKRLRVNNPPKSRLPPPAKDTKRPDLYCADRAEFIREDGILIAKLFAGARSLADEGTAYSLRLSTATEWAASIAKPSP